MHNALMIWLIDWLPVMLSTSIALGTRQDLFPSNNDQYRRRTFEEKYFHNTYLIKKISIYNAFKALLH